MKPLIAIAVLLPLVVMADEAAKRKGAEIVPKPSNGMKSAESHGIGTRFLKLLDKRAKFPTPNNWKKNKLTRYISSGRSGHSITIYGVLDDARQIQILGMAQDIVNEGDFGRVYVEFRDAERFAAAGGGWQARSGEKTLRSRIITKAEQYGADQPATAPESKLEGEKKPKQKSEVRP